MAIVQVPMGAPCWFELSSTKPDASSAFYGALFGWQGQVMHTGIGPYTFLRNTTGTIGALAGMPPGVDGPSRWAVYFAVANVDACLAKAKTLGGSEIMAPFDVPGMGRGAFLADPGGAVFALWQSAQSSGGDFAMFEENAFGWVELATRDVKGMRAFYGELLGWKYKESPMPNFEQLTYTEYSVADVRYGGLLPMTKEWGDMPSHWSLYVVVADADAILKRAQELGGSVCVPAFDAPGVGRIGMIGDPTGAMTYVIALSAHS